MPYVLLTGAFLCNAFANIFLKIGSQHGLDLSTWNPFLFISKNPAFVVGIVLFACNALLYFLALRTLPLSVAYPVMVAMSFIIVGSYAIFGIGEQVSLIQIIGYALILAGIALVLVRA